jgi:hypothetical protein
MAVESAADRAAFLDVDEFGLSVTYTRAGGGVSVFAGIVDEVDEMMGLTDPGIVSASPVLTCRTADLPTGAGEGDTLSIDGDTYAVAAPPRHDGTGMTTLTLEAVS